jgi:hypothetical protein
MYRLPSYKPDGRHHCWHGYDLAEPCWGPVSLTDEICSEDYSDCWDFYQCEAHALCHTSLCYKGYKPSPYAEDRDAVPVDDER